MTFKDHLLARMALLEIDDGNAPWSIERTVGTIFLSNGAEIVVKLEQFNDEENPNPNETMESHIADCARDTSPDVHICGSFDSRHAKVVGFMVGELLMKKLDCNVELTVIDFSEGLITCQPSFSPNDIGWSD